MTNAHAKQPKAFMGRNVEKYLIRKAFDVEVNTLYFTDTYIYQESQNCAGQEREFLIFTSFPYLYLIKSQTNQ